MCTGRCMDENDTIPSPFHSPISTHQHLKLHRHDYIIYKMKSVNLHLHGVLDLASTDLSFHIMCTNTLGRDHSIYNQDSKHIFNDFTHFNISPYIYYYMLCAFIVFFIIRNKTSALLSVLPQSQNFLI